ncbi:LADA_0C02564g1_1 [Lachancea dasiensis]|uniref:LADA_0C02564g1_1 n=1 Tax=Lachancea dasiensis TaxID=1072105 RepID=A0A1G4IY52_9SACH|nr:LADA_0C02564g1_1 [Lachancea dasiensis]
MQGLKLASQSSHRTIILPHIIKYLPRNYKVASTDAEVKVYGFDLDHTLIKPKLGGRFSRTADDWTFMAYQGNSSTENGCKTIDTMTDILKQDPNSLIVIFSNQGGVITHPPNSKSCIKFTSKISQVLDAIVDLHTDIENRIWIYASTKKPASLSTVKRNKMATKKVVKKGSGLKEVKQQMAVLDDDCFLSVRKPMPGLYEEFKKDFGASFELQYYCGDAAGRPQDFSDSDKLFAQAIGCCFRTPEEIFS